MNSILINWGCFIAGALFILLWQAFVKGRIFGIIYGAGIIGGALADVACQLWIDVSKLFRREKTIPLDEHEKELS